MTTSTGFDPRSQFLPFEGRWVTLEVDDVIANIKGFDTLNFDGYAKIVWYKALGLIDYNTAVFPEERTAEGLVWIPFSRIDSVEVTDRPPQAEIRRRRAAILGEQPKHEQYHIPPKQPPPPASFDPWATLGAHRLMAFDEVTRLFREKMRTLHPDVNPGRADPEIAALLTQKTVALNRAYDEVRKFYGR